MESWNKPITLTGDIVRLHPLEKSHRDALMKAAADGKLWELWYTTVPSAATIDQYIETALQEQANQNSLPFVVLENSTGKVVGSTRFLNMEPKNRRLEIGNTWYAKSTQRTGVNTSCKILLLQYAFETLQCIAVEFRTHWHNHQSRNAIERLGAKQDGVLRNHKIIGDGLIRDTVVFSILDTEWPSVKQSLHYKMQR